MVSFPNQQRVIREVGKAYDLIKELHALLQFKSTRKLGAKFCMNEMAQPLFQEALQGLNLSLHIMKSGMPKLEMKQEITGTKLGASCCVNQDNVLLDDLDQRISNRSGKRIRTENNSWISSTTMPYDDGYQWRKYGEKKSSGTNFPRSYFRCTFKEEQGCLAKKIVQQTTNKNPPHFQVKYTDQHTCNFQRSIPPVQEQKLCQHSYKRNNYIPPHMHPCLDDEGLKETLSSQYTVETSSEWDVDALIMELVGFDPNDANLLLT